MQCEPTPANATAIQELKDSHVPISSLEDLEKTKLRQRKARARVVGWSIALSIMTVLGAAAIPSSPHHTKNSQTVFTTCGGSKSGGRIYLGLINKGQQVFYEERRTFSNTIEELGLGLKSETESYKYSIRTTKDAAFSYGTAKDSSLKSYVGAVFILPSQPSTAKVDKNIPVASVSILCEATTTGVTQLAAPFLQNGKATCPQGARSLET